MKDLDVDVGRATDADLNGIMALQAENQTERGGLLAAELPPSRVVEMMLSMPLIVARRAGRIVGFLMTTTREMNSDLPVVQAMFAAYYGASDAYVYGPICVDESERGKGLAQAMFAELRRLEPGREGVLFIRQNNSASIRAHERMGMRQVAEFRLQADNFLVFSFVG
ncbi:N-acetyltransferase family protein [Burkholderia sp. AW49-1]